MSQSEVVSDKQDSVNNVPESENSTNSKKPSDKQKVDIFLKPTGNAPIMKTKKWTVDSDKPIGWIIEFVKKYLKLETNEKLVNILITVCLCKSDFCTIAGSNCS
ncbi:hypothetical protein ABEB36_004971 [Hypothenemus hampei]|uniref:Ubiquitin-like protein ATG12 n=1 Tax=Hypothenemus hampei TaxID=57062 RepID=A0ABD1EWJ9_HYPHA